jgi:hypothetical protein
MYKPGITCTAGIPEKNKIKNYNLFSIQTEKGGELNNGKS